MHKITYRGKTVTRNNISRLVCATLASFLALPGLTQTQADASSEGHVRSAFATSLILTDSETVQFGLLTFDTEALPFVDQNDLASEQSLERRRNIRTFSLPGKWQLGEEDDRLRPFINARFSYFEAEQEFVTNTDGESGTNNNKDRVYGGALEGGLDYELTNQWNLRAGVGAHLLHFKNNYDGTGSIAAPVAPATDALAFDTSATALMGEIQGQATYATEIKGVPWQFQSAYSYYAGETVQTDDNLGEVQPETWSWANGVTVYLDMPQVLATSNSVKLLARRVEVGGDVKTTLATDHYYQFGVGWLFDLTSGNSWFKHVGVSVSFNTGSALSGGSLDVLYNEQWRTP